MSAPLWWAHLNSSSPRYATWREILGDRDVPLKSPGSFETDLGDPISERDVECYLLDWAGMKAAQKYKLAEFISQKFGCSLSDALTEGDERSYPIRAADVIVAFSLRAFI
jgi:hypothetical protein